MIKAAWPVIQPNALVLDTRDAILHVAPLLQELAERCGHVGGMHWVHYLLEDAGKSRRIPYLVLMLRPEEHQGRSLCADDVEAAALFFEYRIFGRRSGAVATADAKGFSSVIAPAGEARRMATLAARALVARGADIVLASYEADEGPDPTANFSGWPSLLSASRRRQAQDGGTQTIEDLIVRRKSIHSATLRWVSGFFTSPHSVLGRANFLASVLRDPELQWIPGVQPPRPARPVLGKTAPSQRTA